MPNIGDTTLIEFKFLGYDVDTDAIITPVDDRLLIEGDSCGAMTLHVSDAKRVEWKAPPMEPLPTEVGTVVIADAGEYKEAGFILTDRLSTSPWYMYQAPDRGAARYWETDSITRWRLRA